MTPSTTMPRWSEHGITVLERGWLSSNNIVLAAPAASQTVLVDTGYVSHAPQTLALVRDVLGGRPLDRIVNTHLHSDHCGGNALLQETFTCTIDVPAGEAAKVDRWDEQALTYVGTGQRCPRFRRTGSVSPGDVIEHAALRWTVHAAPGHDPESVVLHEPALGVLISADALWANGFGVVFPELAGEPGFDDVRRTLELIAALDVRCVIPGHGAPFTDVAAALDRAFHRLRGLAADPAKHARHAAKVLIKFHLLEIQHCSREALERWLAGVPYLAQAHRAHFARENAAIWRQSLLNELASSGALRIDGTLVHDH